MNDNASNDAVFLEWSRGKDEVVRLMTQVFNGQVLVHLRIWSRGAHGQLFPTERGLTIPHDKLSAVRKALRKVNEKIKLGRGDEGNKTAKTKKVHNVNKRNGKRHGQKAPRQ
jgi:hypothetical protein